jgi:hypothetical protein
MSATNTEPKTIIGPVGITSGTGHFGYLSIGNLKPQSSVTPGSSLTLMGYSDDGNLISIDSTKMPDSINLKIESQTDQQIVFTFDYPPQILIGSLSIPTITSFEILVNDNSYTRQTQSPYVKTDNLPPLQKIIIQNKVDNTDLYRDKNNIQYFSIYYTNRDSSNLIIKYNSKTYSTNFKYSTPQNSNPTPILLTNLFGVTGVTGTYYSQYSDQSKTTSQLFYTLNMHSESNSICYGFSTGTTGITGTNESGIPNPYNFNLIPETTYKITASALNGISGPTGTTNRIIQNNTLGPTGGPTGFISFTTPLFSNDITSSNINNNANSTASTIEAKSLIDNNTYNIFKGGEGNNITSDTISIPINYTLTRGKKSKDVSPLIKIYGSISNVSEIYKTSDLTFDGFDSGETSTKSAQGINKNFTITSTKNDAYKGTSTEGFYLNADTVLSIPVDSLPKSSLLSGLNTLTITATYPGLNITKNYIYNNIRYDGPYANASFFSTNFSFNNSNNITGRYICGIYTVQTLPTINFNATILNLGTNYYNAKQLLDFNVTTENDSISTSPYFSIAPITTLPSGTTDLSSVNFTNTLTLIPNQTQKVYSQYIRITPNVYNSINTKSIGSGYYGYLPIVYDINSILTTSISEIFNTSTSVEGCRVQTFSGGNEMIINPFSPNNITNTVTTNGLSVVSPYSDYPFNTPSNNNISLVNSNELLYANGMYVTPVTPGIKPEYYALYDTIKFGNVEINNPDYNINNLTSISPMRYATFAWKTKVSNCSKIVFALKNASRQITSNEFNNSSFTLYYRIEDSTILTTLGLAKSTETDINNNNYLNYYGTTNWIIGSPSSINTTYVLSNNYTNKTLNFTGYNTNTFTTDLSFNVTLPSQNAGYLAFSTPYYYIYCRIAIDITKLQNFSFSNITAQILT